MVTRSDCLYKNEYLGIETLYTVIQGKQINIPEKLEWFREKSRNNELFCTCGCGANLTVVAGEKGLRDQHFRIKKGSQSQTECTYIEEGKISIDSKIVLKCWLDDKIQTTDLESRVPICAIDDTKRKYEFTLLSRQKKIAVNYCHDKANLSDEKMQILDENSKGIHLIHVIDAGNSGTIEQYPEGPMKVQARQGYCLYLEVATSQYDKAHMFAAFYEKDLDGLWKEITFANGFLKDYSIDLNGVVSIHSFTLSSLKEKALQEFTNRQEKERLRREEVKRELEEQRKKREAERKRQEEQQKKWEEQRRKAEEEAAARRAKLEAEREAERKTEEETPKQQYYQSNLQKDVEKEFWDDVRNSIQKKQEQKAVQKAEEDAKKEALFRKFQGSVSEKLNQQETPVIDPFGNRWLRCEFCKKEDTAKEFFEYGGQGRINTGTCYECSKKGLRRPPLAFSPEKKPQTVITNSDTCPICGAKLVKRNGKFGPFMGCPNFPKCRFTKDIIQ